MPEKDDFDLRFFMPYLLNQAADATGRGFETYYKSKYGMLRTEWRVIFHVGRYGQMTAKEICARARIHKTKVSRAVRALETKRYLKRKVQPEDRRHELLSLTPTGARVFDDLVAEAQAFDARLLAGFSDAEVRQVREVLGKLAGL